MEPKKLETQIRKTGFVLENQVAQILKSAGWTVISNKYYVDDFEESVREIDLVAYQVQKVQHFDVYTVLVVSCKKSESNVWALLARDINLRDPNSDWWPLHAWTNDKALLYQLDEPGAAKRYHEGGASLGVQEALNLPSVEVFAFQEMDRSSGSPQNDKPIFSAVTSLMKAQAYELGALPLRKKAPSIYQFNLLSVVDAELARLMFRGDDITATEVESEHYLARYIVKKKETFSRIRFIRSNVFADVLKDYGRLHQANAKWFGSLCDSFYNGIMKDYRRNNVLLDDFKKLVSWELVWRIRQTFNITVEIDSYWFHWDKEASHVSIGLKLEGKMVDFLNGDPQFNALTKSALEKIYRYAGSFVFEVDDIPF
ncbi:MAG: hypothetical protein ABFE02_16935 [Sulfuricella sp.]